MNMGKHTTRHTRETHTKKLKNTQTSLQTGRAHRKGPHRMNEKGAMDTHEEDTRKGTLDEHRMNENGAMETQGEDRVVTRHQKKNLLRRETRHCMGIPKRSRMACRPARTEEASVGSGDRVTRREHRPKGEQPHLSALPPGT